MIQHQVLTGFVAAVMQTSIDLYYFSRIDSSDKIVIDTRNLSYCLFAIRMKWNQRSDSDKGMEMERIRSLIEKQAAMQLVLYRINWSLQDNSVAPLEDITAVDETRVDRSKVEKLLQLLDEVAKVCTLIIDIVSHVFNDICDRSIREESHSALHKLPIYSRSGLNMKKELVALGLCPNFVSNAGLRPYTTQCWMAWWAFQTRLARVENHEGCREEACLLDNVGDIETQHQDGCKGCCFVKPSQRKVYKALKAGTIPLMQIRKDRKGTVTSLAVSHLPIRRLGSVKFVAFSHVWRHGLGSVTETGLPACSLATLWAYLERCFGESNKRWDGTLTSAPFWIDSLCIPSVPHYRKRAIGTMNRIYHGAYRVLVIDKALVKMRLTEHSTESILAAVRISAWQTRYVGSINIFRLHIRFMFLACLLMSPQAVDVPRGLSRHCTWFCAG